MKLFSKTTLIFLGSSIVLLVIAAFLPITKYCPNDGDVYFNVGVQSAFWQEAMFWFVILGVCGLTGRTLVNKVLTVLVIAVGFLEVGFHTMLLAAASGSTCGLTLTGSSRVLFIGEFLLVVCVLTNVLREERPPFD